VEDDSPDDRASLADIQERQTRLEERLKKYGIIERFEAMGVRDIHTAVFRFELGAVDV
jgi:hypothetical protein